MFDLIKAFRDTFGIDATWSFVAIVALMGALAAGFLAWIADGAYRNALKREAAATSPGVAAFPLSGGAKAPAPVSLNDELKAALSLGEKVREQFIQSIGNLAQLDAAETARRGWTNGTARTIGRGMGEPRSREFRALPWRGETIPDLSPDQEKRLGKRLKDLREHQARLSFLERLIVEGPLP